MSQQLAILLLSVEDLPPTQHEAFATCSVLLIVMPTIVNHVPHMFYYHKKKGGRNMNFKAASGLGRRNF